VDPEFGIILREAVKHGVEAYAWTTHFDESSHEIVIDQSIPIDLTPPESSV
jgi:DNA-binding sugar fermentation-stimulating protein